MAITLISNFSYNGKNPNFERDSVAKISDLRAVDPTKQKYDYGHIVFCVEDGKHYRFMYNYDSQSNTGFNDTTGWFKEFVAEGTGSGGENKGTVTAVGIQNGNSNNEVVYTQPNDKGQVLLKLKTINNTPIEGEGNITISGGGGEKTTEEEIIAMGFTKNEGTITAVEVGEEVDNPELGYATKEEVNESLLGKIDRTEVQEKFDVLEEGLSELGSKVNSLDIQLESNEYVNIMSNQTVLSDIGGNGLQYIVKQGDVLFQASKVSGVGKDAGDYYYVNFQLNSDVFWEKNHQYYCAIDVLANSNISDTLYLSTDAKFNNPNIVGYHVSKTKIPTGQRGWLKNLIEVNREETIELYPNANRLFVSFWHKIYPNDVFDIKIYNIILIDLGIPGTEYYKSWEEVDIIFSQGTKEYSVSTARLAHKLKVGNIECWGDSLTAQNYGKYVQGANVYTYGFGGKSSTYIRDEFLSKANKDVTQVVWVGRNNSTETDVVIDDIRDMVSALTHNNFIVMCPPNGYYGEFGTNGADGTGEMKGGNAHSKFLELERRLSEEYPSNFLNIRKAIIEGWRMGNVRLLSDFTQPSVGSNVTIEVSDATYLTTYNSYDLDKFGQDFMTKIRIGVNGIYDVYKIIEKVDDTHLTVQLEESNRITVGSTVGNITDSGGNSAVKYLRVMQNADYMCWLYDTTPSTFRKDGIHMTEDGLKLVAQVVSRKLTAMKLL